MVGWWGKNLGTELAGSRMRAHDDPDSPLRLVGCEGNPKRGVPICSSNKLRNALGDCGWCGGGLEVKLGCLVGGKRQWHPGRKITDPGCQRHSRCRWSLQLPLVFRSGSFHRRHQRKCQKTCGCSTRPRGRRIRSLMTRMMCSCRCSLPDLVGHHHWQHQVHLSRFQGAVLLAVKGKFFSPAC